MTIILALWAAFMAVGMCAVLFTLAVLDIEKCVDAGHKRKKTGANKSNVY